MTIAYDADSNPTAGTGDLSWTHTPAGTPAGAMVIIVQNAGTTDEVVGVTYGGTAMTRIEAVFHIAGGEDGSVYIYLLGASVPAGAQTVVVDVNATGSTKQAVVVTVTAAADVEEDTSNVVDSAGAANPSIVLATTAATETFIVGGLQTGLQVLGDLAPGADYTEMLEHDFGNQIGSWVYRTSNGTGGNITVDWVGASEQFGIAAAAIKEVAGAATIEMSVGLLKMGF